ncbi:MAG TPA: VTT domain-containing protein [Burkholderiales bacterium]|nr:VTT domain-containing protein [Burkholderiales bacterium]
MQGAHGKLIVAAVAVVALFAAWFLLPVKQWLGAFSGWMEGLGVWGGVLFALIYVVGTLLLAPGSLLTIAAGLAFGLGGGFPVIMVGATIGAAAAFLVARYLVRERIQGMIEKRPKLQAVDKAVAEDGWKIVLLMRLTPIVPFNIQNYFFGLTRVDFGHYVIATAVGIIPGTLLYLYIGAIGGALAGGGRWGTGQWILFGLGLLATLVVVVLVTKKAKEKLKEAGVTDEPAIAG